MTSLRDLNCGNDVAMMDKLGRFDREFIVYGCAYYDKGEPYYLVSSRADTLDAFLKASSARSLYPTPVMTALTASSVPAGAHSELAQSAKLSLAHRLKNAYRPSFWPKLKQLTDLAATDSAALLIEDRLQALNGCFEPEPLALMGGLLEMALAQKVLTRKSYQDFSAQLNKWLRQMEDDVVIKAAFRRTFSGFGYQTPDGAWHYFYDGEAAVVCARQRHLFSQGLVVTPILQKTYWFDGQTPVSSIAQRFAQTLSRWLEPDFLALVKSLWQLPPAGGLTRSLALDLTDLNETESAALKGYAYCYRLIEANHSRL